MTDEDREARLTALEETVAELLRGLDELGEMTRQQWSAIERLQGEVKALKQEVLTGGEGDPAPGRPA